MILLRFRSSSKRLQSALNPELMSEDRGSYSYNTIDAADNETETIYPKIYHDFAARETTASTLIPVFGRRSIFEKYLSKDRKESNERERMGGVGERERDYFIATGTSEQEE